MSSPSRILVFGYGRKHFGGGSRITIGPRLLIFIDDNPAESSSQGGRCRACEESDEEPYERGEHVVGEGVDGAMGPTRLRVGGKAWCC